MESLSTTLYNKELTDEDAYNYNDEKIVIEEVAENIEFIFFEFTGIQEVEYLQEDKDIEKESQVRSFLWTPN